MRITRKDTVHAIRLKLSEIWRFIVSSMVSIVAGGSGWCCQENSAKCEDL